MRKFFLLTLAAVLLAGGIRSEADPLPTVEIDLPNMPEDAVPLTMVLIPPGSFEMGSPEDERGRFPDEGPVRTVNIEYEFYMGKFAVTQAQWTAVMGENPTMFSMCGDDCPVDRVSWLDVQRFLRELNELGLGEFRLPTEAEWEYACRAGTQTRFYFGDSLDAEDDCVDHPVGDTENTRGDYMWYCANNQFSGPKPVGQTIPNAFGLYDMSGNVMEWVQDHYHRESYAEAPVDGSEWVPPRSFPSRVVRGGSWGRNPRFLRSAWRGQFPPHERQGAIGFRLVMEAQ